MMGSIRKKIIIVFGLSITALLMIMGYFTYSQVSNTIIPLTENMITQVADARSEEVSRWLEGRVDEIRAIATQDAIKSGDMEQIKPYLSSRHNYLNEDMFTMWFADLDGNFYATDGAQANVSEREDFKAITEGGKDIYISNPVIAKITGDPIFTITYPVKDENNNLVGVFAGVVVMDKLSEIASGINIGNNGFGLMVDGNGLVIAHPDDAVRLSLNLSTASEQGYEGLDKTAERMNSGESGTEIYTDPNGHKSILVFSSIEGTPGWSLGIEMPLDQMRQATVLEGSRLSNNISMAMTIFITV